MKTKRNQQFLRCNSMIQSNNYSFKDFRLFINRSCMKNSKTIHSLKVNSNVFTSWFLMIEFGPQNTVSKLFLTNLFSFSRYRPSKSGTSAGSILGFTRFPKIIIGKPSSVTSQVIKAPWSVQSAATYLTAKQVETAKFDGFWKKLWFTALLMTA